MKYPITLTCFSLIMSLNYSCKPEVAADLIFFNGKIVTADNNFTIAEAVAISGDTILAVGTNSKIKSYKGENTKAIDLQGKTVIPGIIDSHLHPETAAVSELEEEIPDARSVVQLLAWIRSQTLKKEKGSWIIFPKFFPTRLAEMRQPTLSELDSAAPGNPVFLNGSFGGIINSAAMRQSGITSETKNAGIIKNKTTGKPTGFIRASAFGMLKIPGSRQISQQEQQEAIVGMLNRYNRYGITSIFSGAGDFESIKMYRRMADKKMLTARVYQNILFSPEGKVTNASVNKQIKEYLNTTGYGDEWVKVGSLKVFLDGGILTGTAYMQEPWGAKAVDIFGIEDPSYRGIINYTREELHSIVSAANECNWSFTAHATGEASVKLLLDVYNEVNKEKSIKNRRFSIIHGNFFSKEDIELMEELGVYANVQPAWFFKDADAMQYILGNERIRAFHPNLSMINSGIIVNGGSDHMVKWDADASVNPYNPFLAMWSMITRKTERGSVINPEQAVSREQALKIYTINNAYASFEESIKGSIESGKLADMAVISDDLLTCPAERIRDIKALMTIVGGKIVYSTEILRQGNYYIIPVAIQK